MFTPIKEREVIDDADIVRYQKIRVAKEYFNNLIKDYLKKNHISIAEITKKDINYLGKKYNEKDREILIQQVMYHLETSFGKPLKRIKENDKSALFREIDSDGWINSWAKKTNIESWEEWSISTASEDGRWDLRGDEETDSSPSG